jgi:formylmethanofuran dehydrogenase subunit B
VTTFHDTTCLGCGCACDDIEVVAEDGHIVETRNACPLGVDWFGDGRVPARARASGRDVSTEEALDAAARLLARSGRALVYLAPDISCEAQREGVALADVLHATLDSVTSATALGSILAAQERGRAGATLGEIRNRADMLVFWAIDPSSRYPRYWTRYAPEAVGVHAPDGRRSRIVVAVDIGDSCGPVDADVRIAVSPAEEVATLTAIRAMVQGAVRLGADSTITRAGGTVRTSPWAIARELTSTLLTARYLVVVADAEPEVQAAQRDPGRAAALIALTQALNGPTRCALSSLRGGGNRSGADAVVTWQTGYPAAVDFARGHPRYRPYDGTASARLARGEVDAVLVVGSAALVPADVLSMMARVPAAIVGPRASESALSGGDAVIDCGVAGIHESGMAMRMDDVPLPLRALVAGPPPAAVLVRALSERINRHLRTATRSPAGRD